MPRKMCPEWEDELDDFKYGNINGSESIFPSTTQLTKYIRTGKLNENLISHLRETAIHILDWKETERDISLMVMHCSTPSKCPCFIWLNIVRNFGPVSTSIHEWLDEEIDYAIELESMAEDE